MECVGLDFLAHPLWDKYIEFEERSDAHDRIFMILSRVIHIPLHQYARYFERYRVLAKSRPLTETAPMEIITKYRDEVLRESGPKQKNERELEQELRNKINAFHMEVFQRTQTETTKRWTYESEVKRPYYHVTELDEGQLSNWRRYLDFEQAEGSYVRTKFLYERCVVTAADYEEFWLRYARWMMAQEGKEEEVRNIYQRASCVFVPISQPAVRSYYAQFEESQGRPEVAIAVYEAILMHMPSHTESIISLANVHRRQHGLQVAIDLLKTYVEHPECTIITRGTLVSEWARLAWRVSGKSDDARKVYESNKKQYSDCGPFWIAWLKFELQLPTSEAGEPACYKRIKSVFDQIRQSRLPPDVVQDLAGRYFAYLAERGGKDAMVEYMQLDKEISGPKVAEPVVEVQPEVAQTGKKKRKGNVNTAQANQHHHNQQGQAQAVNGR